MDYLPNLEESTDPMDTLKSAQLFMKNILRFEFRLYKLPINGEPAPLFQIWISTRQKSSTKLLFLFYGP